MFSITFLYVSAAMDFRFTMCNLSFFSYPLRRGLIMKCRLTLNLLSPAPASRSKVMYRVEVLEKLGHD